MRPRTVAVLLLVAGGLLAASLVKQLLFPGFVEFLLITVAHLVLAVAVAGVSVFAIRPRSVALVLGLLWGLGWAGLHLREALMLLFVLPPAWLSPVVDIGIVSLGIACGVAAIVWHRGSTAAGYGVPSGFVLFLAVLSSTFLWAGWIIRATNLLPTSASWYALLSADALSALALLLLGGFLLRRASRRAPRHNP